MYLWNFYFLDFFFLYQFINKDALKKGFTTGMLWKDFIIGMQWKGVAY